MAVYLNGKQVDVGANFQLSNIVVPDYEYDIGVVNPVQTGSNTYEVNLSANTANVLSTQQGSTYLLKIPLQKTVGGVRKVRDFLMKMYGHGTLDFSFTDVGGNPLTYEFDSAEDSWDAIADTSDGDLHIYGFTENEIDHMMVSVKGLSAVESN